MDPASLSNLDPKLRETYERVMGTTGSAASQPPVSPDALSTPAVDPILANTATPDQPQTVTIDQPLPNPAASNIITPPHGHGGLLKVFYVLGGVVFFVIYTIFCMKLLNVSLPF